MTIRNLNFAFAPQSVALIGASSEPGTVGSTVLANLNRSGFAGMIWPVNPRHDRIGDQRCYAKIEDLPAVPDLAVITTPASIVPDQIARLGKLGTRAAVIITAGLNSENGLRQAALDAARPYCLRIIGPNCLGICVPPIGLNASFAHLTPGKGKLAFISQSGALVSAVLDWADTRQIGFSYVVSMGEMADVDVGDMLDFLAGDTLTSAILMYLETITNPQKFMSAARSAARVKPVIVVKSGRHSASAKAAATHTGALAGTDAIADAAFHRAGVLRVIELEELFDAAEGLTRLRPIDGDRLCIVTNGGGAGVMAVDALLDLGGRLAEIGSETVARLDAAMPPTWSRANPVDIIGDAGPDRYRVALDSILDDSSVDAVLVMNCPTAVASSTDAAASVIETLHQRKKRGLPAKPAMACWLGEKSAHDARRFFAESNIPSYATPADAIRGFSYLTGYSKAHEAMMRTPPSLPAGFEVDAAAARAIFAEAHKSGRDQLNEPEAKSVLAAFGIPTVPTRIATDPADVERHAALLLKSNEAIALKILSQDISHKSDVGGVQLNLRSAEAARIASALMLEHIQRLRPGARIQGFTVQPMVIRPEAYELIIGMTEDRIFGPALMFGAGGTSVEVVRDTSFALPPLDFILAGDLIRSTRIYSQLKGFRDRKPADIDAIAMTLLRVSQMIVDCPEIRELDINPLLADASGVIAVDARIRFDSALLDVPPPNRRLAIRPYPSGWKKDVVTRGGKKIVLRPIMPADEALYADFISRLEPGDVRMRFLAPRKEFSHGFIARFTQIDYARAMAFVALDGSERELLGVSRLAAEPDYVKAEFAIIVRSDLKNLGIGWELMQQLLAYAKAEGLQELNGETLAENSTLITLAKELGFEVRRDPEDADVMSLKIDLGGGRNAL